MGVTGVLAVAAIAVGVMLSLISQHRYQKRLELQEAERAAADWTRPENLPRLVANGLAPGLRDREKNTPLHLAYYYESQESIERLREYGADEHLTNKLGLVPAEMADLRRAEELVLKGARLLSAWGGWLERQAGRRAYDALQEIPLRIYEPALVRVLLAHRGLRQLIFLAVKLGRPSISRMIEILKAYGDRTVATHYLNSGSDELATAAREWAHRHGYQIHYESRVGATHVRWGQF